MSHFVAIQSIFDIPRSDMETDRKRWATALGARSRCVRRDQRNLLGPGHHQVHLEPPRDPRRLFGVSHAALADSVSC